MSHATKQHRTNEQLVAWMYRRQRHRAVNQRPLDLAACISRALIRRYLVACADVHEKEDESSNLVSVTEGKVEKQ
jgi:hypothetical protein